MLLIFYAHSNKISGAPLSTCVKIVSIKDKKKNWWGTLNICIKIEDIKYKKNKLWWGTCPTYSPFTSAPVWRQTHRGHRSENSKKKSKGLKEDSHS